VQEQLDIILTAAAFDQSVSLLFLDDAVLQLRNNQQPDLMKFKDISAILKALEIYDVQDIYIEMESLQARALKVGDLILPVKEIHRKQVVELMRQFDFVMGA
jgi:tRNA 2-thiouridine synthesizing protein C